jgi:hypothetical protein
MGLIGCPGTSVRNYRFTLRIISEQRRSIPYRGGSPKSFNVTLYFVISWLSSVLEFFIFLTILFSVFVSCCGVKRNYGAEDRAL